MARRPVPQLPPTQTDYLPFTGGLDEVSSTWEVKPGRLRQAVNYEIGIEGGYQDILGYERFDGTGLPSDAVYTLLPVEMTGSFAVGDTIHGGGYPLKRWAFESDLEDWTGTNNLALSWESPGLIRAVVLGPSQNPVMYVPLSGPTGVVGCNATLVRAKVRRVAGIGDLDFRLYYGTTNHANRQSDYHKQAPLPVDPAEWNIVEWDMTALTAGGDDWIDSVITRFDIDLSQGPNSAGDEWEIQYVELINPGTGATARIAGQEGDKLILVDQVGEFGDETLWIGDQVVGHVAGGGVAGDRPLTVEIMRFRDALDTGAGGAAIFSVNCFRATETDDFRGVDIFLQRAAPAVERVSFSIAHTLLGRIGYSTDENGPGFINVHDGNWHRISVTYDGSMSITGAKVYVDGVLQPKLAGSENNALPSVLVTDEASPLRIGSRTTAGGEVMQGALGEVADARLWTVERTAQQIDACRTVRLSGNEDGLVGYWPLDEGSGTTIADKTGTQDGTFLGEPVWTSHGSFPFSGVLFDGLSAIDVPHYYGAPEIEAPTAAQAAAYQALAANAARDDIDPVPGSGRILGVYQLGTTVYAFRNNEAGTAARVYGSSPTGWQQIDLGREIAFTSGSSEISEGDTITGATSAATATVERVIVTTGDWGDGDAAGKLVLSDQTGTFQAENLDVGVDTNVATIAGDSSAITLLPDGRYEFWEGKFGRGGARLYGCDGANPGFEFDGRVFVQIETGMVPDAPTHVCVHQNHLFFSFGPSVQHSAIGNPYLWTPLLGAGELAVLDDVTGFQPEPGSQGGAALGVYSRNIIHVLYGNSSDDWALVPYRDKVGAYPYSIQQLAQTLFLDDRGATSLTTSQAYGNFQHATLSQLVQPTINQKRSSVTASCIVRDKNQARLFFNDGSGLYFTFKGQGLLGIMPVQFPDTVRCMFSIEGPDGREQIMFGSDDGYVYKMESGFSFDGEPISGYLMLHYHHSKDPRRDKHYTGVEIEASGTGYAEFSFSYELGYTGTEIAQPNPRSVELNLAGTFWDSFIWDGGFWDGQTLSPTFMPMEGEAHNVSLIIRKDSDAFAPIRFSGALLEYRWRRKLR